MNPIEYTRIGAGTPVVLVHGIGHRRNAWGSVPDLLAARGFEAICVDMPGHGISPKNRRPKTYSMNSNAATLEAFFAEIGVKNPHVAGNSLGGQMALELAARSSVASAVAFSPAGFYLPHELLVVGSQLLSMKAGSYAPTFVHRYVNARPALKKQAQGAIYRHPEKLDPAQAVGDTLAFRRAKGFWPSFFRAIGLWYRNNPQVPTMIAWGTHDRLLIPAQARRARQRYPHLEHRWLPDSGHSPMLDHPELVVEAIVDMVAKAEENSAKPTARVSVRQ